MNPSSRQRKFIRLIALIVLFGIFLLGNLEIIILVYLCFAVIMCVRTAVSSLKPKKKAGLFISYFFLLAGQIVFCEQIVFHPATTPLLDLLSKLLATGFILLPLTIERFVRVNHYSDFYLPSIDEMSTVSFELLRERADRVTGVVHGLEKVAKTVSPQNLDATIGDLHRHSSLRYINKGTLTEEYFTRAYESLEDPYIYIVISNTGSPASELISLFTQKQFNHASLSFDSGLQTIISYNGGANVYPPGLNPEMIEFFHQKTDASILVYRLDASFAQKKCIIDKVQEINAEGSAYNIVGLALRFSYKPNIMFCSQFVYNMLKLAGLSYFEKADGHVRPTDLIELDYYKKLTFVAEINF